MTENNLTIRGFTVLVMTPNPGAAMSLHGIYHDYSTAESTRLLLNRQLAKELPGAEAFVLPVYDKSSAKRVIAFIKSKLIKGDKR